MKLSKKFAALSLALVMALALAACGPAAADPTPTQSQSTEQPGDNTAQPPPAGRTSATALHRGPEDRHPHQPQLRG